MSAIAQDANPAPRVLVLVGSPRRNGNSATLAEAVRRGAEAAGCETSLRFLDDHIAHFLRDCRQCRRQDGTCGIEDGFAPLFLEEFLKADATVLCTPIYWYGMSAQAKAFFDRSFCHYAASNPGSTDVLARMRGKRLGLVLSSEESYPGAELGLVHQLQEYARYTRSQFVGVVRGVGNSRGEVARDPGRPVLAAEALGRELFSRGYTDYRLETPRSPRVWG